MRVDWVWSPDSRKLAGLAYDGGSRRIGIYAVNRDGSGLNLLVNGTLYDSGPFWSNDSAEIFWARYGNLYVMSSEGSNNRYIAVDYLSDWVYLGGLKLSPDGGKVAFVTVGSREEPDILYVTRSDFSDPITIDLGGQSSNFHNRSNYFLTWSPDGRYLLVSCCSGLRQMVIDSDTGEELTLLDPAEGRMCGWTPDGDELVYLRSGNIYFANLSQSDQAPHQMTYFNTGYLEVPWSCPVWLP